MSKVAFYEINEAKNDQLYFVLKAPNNKVIATSETYETMQACEKGIASCQRNAGTTEIRGMKQKQKVKQSDPLKSMREYFEDNPIEYAVAKELARQGLNRKGIDYAAIVQAVLGAE